MNIRTRFPHSDLKSVLLNYARIKAGIVKRNSSSGEREMWNAVPEIDAYSVIGDIVKDFSVDSRTGHVGVVSDVELVTKRDGREAVRIHMQFINHTPEAQRSGIKTRKVEFILNDNQ